MKSILLIALTIVSLSSSASDLKTEMNRIGDAVKAVMISIKKGGFNDEDLRQVSAAKDAANKSIELTPAMNAEGKAIYKDMMVELLHWIEQLEVAVGEGDTDSALKVVKEMMRLKREGHALFREE